MPDDDDNSDAWAHQIEIEHQRYEYELATDPGYLVWLEQIARDNLQYQMQHTTEV